MSPEYEDMLRLIGLLVGALRETGDLSESEAESGEPQFIADALRRLVRRAGSE